MYVYAGDTQHYKWPICLQLFVQAAIQLCSVCIYTYSFKWPGIVCTPHTLTVTHTVKNDTEHMHVCVDCLRQSAIDINKHKMISICGSSNVKTVHVLALEHFILPSHSDHLCMYKTSKQQFQTSCQTLSLTQVVSEATNVNTNGTTTLIDLALVSTPSLLQNCEVISPIGNSDHNGILLQLKWKSNQQQVRSQPRPIWR